MATIYNSQLDAFELYHLIQESRGDKNISSQLQRSILPALGHGLAGSAGAAISNIATYPLDLIITRLQIQRQLRKDPSTADEAEYTGLLDAARKIYEGEGGIPGFYTGLWQDTGKTIADSFIFFLAYNFLRERRLKTRSHGRSLPAIDELSVGFVAGSLTKLLTTPIANIVTRKQAAALTKSRDGGDSEAARSPSSTDIANEIMSDKGWTGFWSGYSASLILTLNPTLTFFLFETLKRMFLPRARRDNPPPAATFLLSAISKACASSVTYPFSLAKARAQAGSKKEAQEEKEVVDEDLQSQPSKKAAHATVFGTVFAISQAEGVGALYEGLHLEVVKAFFGHGMTMLAKQAIQRLLVKAYYVLSIIISRYRRTGSLRKRGKKIKRRSVEYYDLAIARASEKAEEAGEAVKAKANETAEFVAEYVEEENGEWRNLYGTTGLAKWFDTKNQR